MINIGSDRDLAPIASLWASDLRHYLTEVLTGNRRVKATNKKGGTIYFSRRTIKFYYRFLTFCEESGLPKKEREETLKEIIVWYKDFDKNITGGKDVITDLVTRQKKWKNNDKISRTVINKVFVEVFDDFTGAYAYKYLKLLNIRTCPYCNRNYTFTLNKDESEAGFSTRPELDHFHDKSTYPLLALSFFNLVPSCHECNHGKLKKSTGVNPYFKGFASKFVIASAGGIDKKLDANEIRAIRNVDDFSITFENPSAEEQQNIKSLGLSVLYNEHKDFVMELVDKSVTYDKILQKGIVDSFQGIFHSPQEVHDLIFGGYLSDAEQEKRPLSKLTSDILDQLHY